MTNVEPRRGQRFTHKHFLHPDDRHLPAQQSRKAVMIITRVVGDWVYYTYAGPPRPLVVRGEWYMKRGEWHRSYGSAEAPGVP